jgi:hypothetical protein
VWRSWATTRRVAPVHRYEHQGPIRKRTHRRPPTAFRLATYPTPISRDRCRITANHPRDETYLTRLGWLGVDVHCGRKGPPQGSPAQGSTPQESLAQRSSAQESPAQGRQTRNGASGGTGRARTTAGTPLPLGATSLGLRAVHLGFTPDGPTHLCRVNGQTAIHTHHDRAAGHQSRVMAGTCGARHGACSSNANGERN